MRASITSCISALLLLTGCTDLDGTRAQPAPMVGLAPLDGHPFADLPALCGRVVQVEFWGSWCGPCERALPAADRLRDTLRRRDFEVLAISLDEDASSAERFLDQVPVRYPIAWDPSRASLRAFAIAGVPTTVLLDRSGRVRDRIDGFSEETVVRIRDGVHRLVRERTGNPCGE